MSGMDVSSLKENENRFTIVFVSEGNPLARVLRAAPMLHQMEQSMGDVVQKPTRFDLRLYKATRPAIEDLVRREIDFAELNAREFVRARARDPKMKALLRIVSPEKRAEACVLFTRQNTSIRTLAELRGRSLLLGPADSTMTFWAKAALVEAGVRASDLSKYRYIDNNFDRSPADGRAVAFPSNGAYKLMSQVEAVKDGLYDAGVAREKRFQEVAAEEHLVPLYQFDDSGDLLVARGDLPEEIVGAFRRVLLDQDGSPYSLFPGGSLRLRPAIESDFNGILANLGVESRFEE
jgi:hypothetical protein